MTLIRCYVSSPAYNIDVGKVCIALGEHAGLGWLGPNVPDLDGSVAGAGGHHVFLVRRPSRQ